MTSPYDELAREFAAICLKASIAVMEIYRSDFTPEQKADCSPVTEADRLCEALILEGLSALLPDTPVLAEESFEAGVRPQVGDRFLLVDPVDGTKEFIKKNGEFTLNIGLIEQGLPVAGCVYAPALERLYVGGDRAYSGQAEPGARLERVALNLIRVREPRSDQRIAVVSRSHASRAATEYAERYGVSQTVCAGSSLKFCMIAEGRADIYPRFTPTMEWDTAAGHSVLAAAGGRMTTPEGAPFLYGKREDGYRNGPFIAAACDVL